MKSKTDMEIAAEIMYTVWGTGRSLNNVEFAFLDKIAKDEYETPLATVLRVTRTKKAPYEPFTEESYNFYRNKAHKILGTAYYDICNTNYEKQE